jgi:hypothetical protein
VCCIKWVTDTRAQVKVVELLGSAAAYEQADQDKPRRGWGAGRPEHRRRNGWHSPWRAPSTPLPGSAPSEDSEEDEVADDDWHSPRDPASPTTPPGALHRRSARHQLEHAGGDPATNSDQHDAPEEVEVASPAAWTIGEQFGWPWSSSRKHAAAAAKESLNQQQTEPEGVLRSSTPQRSVVSGRSELVHSGGVTLHSEVARQNELINTTISALQQLVDSGSSPRSVAGTPISTRRHRQTELPSTIQRLRELVEPGAHGYAADEWGSRMWTEDEEEDDGEDFLRHSLEPLPTGRACNARCCPRCCRNNGAAQDPFGHSNQRRDAQRSDGSCRGRRCARLRCCGGNRHSWPSEQTHTALDPEDPELADDYGLASDEELDVQPASSRSPCCRCCQRQDHIYRAIADRQRRRQLAAATAARQLQLSVQRHEHDVATHAQGGVPPGHGMELLTQLYILCGFLQQFSLLCSGPALVAWPATGLWATMRQLLHPVAFAANDATPLVGFAVAFALPLMLIVRGISRLWLCDGSELSIMDRRDWVRDAVHAWKWRRRTLLACWVLAPGALGALVLALGRATPWVLPLAGVLCLVCGYVLGQCLGRRHAASHLRRLLSVGAVVSLCVVVALGSLCHLFYVLFAASVRQRSSTVGANSTSSFADKAAGQQTLRLMEFGAAAVAVVVPAVFLMRVFLRGPVLSIIHQWARSSGQMLVTCCGLWSSERVRSATMPSFLLGAWVLVSGIWEASDIYGDSDQSLAHPFTPGVLVICGGSILYGVCALVTGQWMRARWLHQQHSDDLFFNLWAWNEYGVLLFVYVFAHLPASTLSFQYVARGMDQGGAYFIIAWALGSFYVVAPPTIVLLVAIVLRRKAVERPPRRRSGDADGQAMTLAAAGDLLAGTWRVEGKDARNKPVDELIVLECTPSAASATYLRVTGTHAESAHDPFRVRGRVTIDDEEGVCRVQFEQQYVKPTPGASPDDKSDSGRVVSWHGVIDPVDTTRLGGWWTGTYYGIPFTKPFRGRKVEEVSAQEEDGESDSAIVRAVASGRMLSDAQYAQLLRRRVDQLRQEEPQVAAAMPLIGQFRQRFWWALPLQMVQQLVLAAALYVCQDAASRRMAAAVICTGGFALSLSRPYVDRDSNRANSLARLSNLMVLAIAEWLSFERGSVFPLPSAASGYVLLGNSTLAAIAFCVALGFGPAILALCFRCRVRCTFGCICPSRSAELELLSSEFELAARDPTVLERYRQQGLSRFHQPTASCCYLWQNAYLARTRSFNELEMLDLRELGVLPMTTKAALAQALQHWHCRHLRVLHMLLVSPDMDHSLNAEQREVAWQERQLGPTDIAILGGWLCAEPAKQAVRQLDISRNFVFGSTSQQRSPGAAGGKSSEQRLHVVDYDRHGWEALMGVLTQPYSNHLTVLRAADVGMGPGGALLLAKALDHGGLRLLEALDISGNPLLPPLLSDTREEDETAADAATATDSDAADPFMGAAQYGSISAVSARRIWDVLCQSFVGGTLRELHLARVGMDAAALRVLLSALATCRYLQRSGEISTSSSSSSSPVPQSPRRSPVATEGSRVAEKSMATVRTESLDVDADVSGVTPVDGDVVAVPVGVSPMSRLRVLDLAGNPLTDSAPFIAPVGYGTVAGAADDGSESARPCVRCLCVRVGRRPAALL